MSRVYLRHVFEPGEMVNAFTVLGRARTPEGKSAWKVRCVCGELRVLLGYQLRGSDFKSCGCQRSARFVASRTTHGATGTRTFRSWQSMKSRCERPNNTAFSHYGGRGISVCQRWSLSFEAFLADMGACPDGLTLERRDVNGNYEPSNCLWVSRRVQMQNTTRSKLITWRGERKSLGAWADSIGASYALLSHRIMRGWSVERAFTEPRKIVRKECRSTL